MRTKQLVYETKGRAREFNELAINLFNGCGHGCVYCYGADVTHQEQAKFITCPAPRVTPEDLYWTAKDLKDRGEKRRILMCFVTDPYQPVERETSITRQAIQIFHNHGLKVIILTKGGQRSMRDFDLLTPEDAYATTLTLFDSDLSRIWEPGAAPPYERIIALREAHRRGIETWVSFEPVVFPDQTMMLLEETYRNVGHYKVGTMNYHPQGAKTDWKKFGFDIKKKLDELGAKYYFKRDLLVKMGIVPEHFKQTWVCR